MTRLSLKENLQEFCASLQEGKHECRHHGSGPGEESLLQRRTRYASPGSGEMRVRDCQMGVETDVCPGTHHCGERGQGASAPGAP